MPPQQESENYLAGRVTDFRSPLFDRCLLILEQSISADARLPRPRLIALLAGGNYRLYAFRLRDDLAGTALLYFSADLPFAFLDYIAIDSQRRNQGLGSAFFRSLVDLIRTEKPGASWLLLEVDDDREGSENSRTTSRRRMEFYRRLGVLLLTNLPYRFPCPDGNSLPMRLMAYRLRPEATLSVSDIASAIENTFLHIHGRDSGDALLAWFQANNPPFLDLE